jgi:hypothetical protein
MNSILIDADPQLSLGGSCIRDILNVSKYLRKNYKKSKIYILSNNITNKRIKNKFPSNCIFLKIINFEVQMLKIIKSIKKGKLFVMITGHGYQKKEKNTYTELDSKDEYIFIRKDKYILDDKLRKLIVDSNKLKIICLIDTCHSATMLDLKNDWVGYGLPRIISISACMDNETETCDVTKTYGYGGALTLHLLENDHLKDLINMDWNGIDILNKNIKRILLKYNQHPLMQYEM